MHLDNPLSWPSTPKLVCQGLLCVRRYVFSWEIVLQNGQNGEAKSLQWMSIVINKEEMQDCVKEVGFLRIRQSFHTYILFIIFFFEGGTN